MLRIIMSAIFAAVMGLAFQPQASAASEYWLVRCTIIYPDGTTFDTIQNSLQGSPVSLNGRMSVDDDMFVTQTMTACVKNSCQTSQATERFVSWNWYAITLDAHGVMHQVISLDFDPDGVIRTFAASGGVSEVDEWVYNAHEAIYASAYDYPAVPADGSKVGEIAAALLGNHQ